MTTEQTAPERIGVVEVRDEEDALDEVEFVASCSIHGRLGSRPIRWEAEDLADDHVEARADCWADHCGGNGCGGPTCVCTHRPSAVSPEAPNA